MGNKWVWKIIMIPACLILIFGLWGALYPDSYMDFYLKQVSNTTLDTFSMTQPEISILVEVMFRARCRLLEILEARDRMKVTSITIHRATSNFPGGTRHLSGTITNLVDTLRLLCDNSSFFIGKGESHVY